MLHTLRVDWEIEFFAAHAVPQMEGNSGTFKMIFCTHLWHTFSESHLAQSMASCACLNALIPALDALTF